MIVKTLYTYPYSITKLHPGICGEDIHMINFYAGAASKKLDYWPIRDMHKRARYWENWEYNS